MPRLLDFSPNSRPFHRPLRVESGSFGRGSVRNWSPLEPGRNHSRGFRVLWGVERADLFAPFPVLKGRPLRCGSLSVVMGRAAPISSPDSTKAERGRTPHGSRPGSQSLQFETKIARAAVRAKFVPFSTLSTPP